MTYKKMRGVNNIKDYWAVWQLCFNSKRYITKKNGNLIMTGELQRLQRRQSRPFWYSIRDEYVKVHLSQNIWKIGQDSKLFTRNQSLKRYRYSKFLPWPNIRIPFIFTLSEGTSGQVTSSPVIFCTSHSVS